MTDPKQPEGGREDALQDKSTDEQAAPHVDTADTDVPAPAPSASDDAGESAQEAESPDALSEGVPPEGVDEGSDEVDREKEQRQKQEHEQAQAEAVAADDDTAEEPPGSLTSEPAADTTQEPAPVAQSAAVAQVKPRGRILATFAFLFALAAVAGVGYLYYLLVYLQPMQGVLDQSDELSQQYAGLEDSLSRQMQDLRTQSSAAIDDASKEQAERMEKTQDAVIKSLNEAINAAPPSQREWKLAEAEYLLRIANHRALMAQDSVGALTLLQAADQIMAELDDFALYQVRARLADEIIALRQVPRDDLQGIYLTIEALKSQLNDLPLPTPAFLQVASPEVVEQNVWQTLLEELKQFITIRNLDSDEALKPLLAPEEEAYLELNLRLALEQAQLATLKRQQEVYLQSLENVRKWFADYADMQDPRTEALLQSVDELLLVELARELPDISGSLNELLELRRSGA